MGNDHTIGHWAEQPDRGQEKLRESFSWLERVNQGDLKSRSESLDIFFFRFLFYHFNLLTCGFNSLLDSTLTESRVW